MEEKFRQIKKNITERKEGRMNALLDPQLCGCDREKQRTAIRFEKKEWERNQRGELHGGAVAAMFDTAMGMSVALFADRDITTADLSVSYIRPFLEDAFRFETEIIHMGRSLARITSKAYGEASGKCLASATSNFAFINR